VVQASSLRFYILMQASSQPIALEIAGKMPAPQRAIFS